MKKAIYILVGAAVALLLLLPSPEAAAQFTMYYGGEEVYRQVKGTPDSIVLSYKVPTTRASQERDLSTVGGTIAQASDAVDLGLPSGTLWAPWNVGANAAGEAGAYFAWGEVQGGKDKTTTHGYQMSTYWWADWDSELSDWNYILKYETEDGQTQQDWYYKSKFIGDGKTSLDMEDDAARANWGGTWRMPTSAEFQELALKCKWEWQDAGEYADGALAGYKVTGPNGNFIFIPAANFWVSSYREGERSYYWTSELSTADTYSAKYFSFSQYSRSEILEDFRYMGRTVRAVCSAAK